MMNKKLKVKIAHTFSQKLFGLMFKKHYHYPLLFKNCKSIHTFWMKFNIDLICLDKSNKVIFISKNIPPNKIFFGPLKTSSIIEIMSSLNLTSNIQIGDFLLIVPHNSSVS